jgi:hypothetical protein
VKFDVQAVRHCLRAFDFQTLFREHLGWDNHKQRLEISVGDQRYILEAVAQKRGFVAFTCQGIPDRATRLKIDHQVTRSVREHFVIYVDRQAGEQIWHWVRRELGKPPASRDHRFNVAGTGDSLIQRLNQIAVSLEEEEKITLLDVARRTRATFDVDKVTRRFYDRFKAEREAFLSVIQGIKADADRDWYASLMLNRLMFVYFIQKKGFLDGDLNYLRNRLAMVQAQRGNGHFHSFYRYFLLRLFHDGLGKPPAERPRDPDFERLLGKVPFLNGGFFEVHLLEARWKNIDIPDEAFARLFDFFDQYAWHLDERPLRANNEINPDVVGYIFEKFVNQKQMGAYYTKEDITEYIAKNKIIPFLFNAAEEACAVAFKPDSALWRLLREDADRYIYPAVRHGVVDERGEVVPESALPDFVQRGMRDPRARMFDKRYNLEQAASGDPLRLVTETWREYVYRRERCLGIRARLQNGEVHQINDLITLNLDIWQFARDAINQCEGPELLRAFWNAIQNVSVLDPTCGSGAFLFAALRILETLYSDCLARMAQFVESLEGRPHHPRQFEDFKQVLAQVRQHPNERYFILKSIIVNNLYGVDIMEEAVEICKLRLFLKLAAQVERFEEIEPLPDIDFNIRAGNALVGYATAEDVRRAFQEQRRGEAVQGKLMFGEDAQAYQQFEEALETVERAFRQFRAQQTTYGGRVTAADKQALRGRLAALTDQLDRLLAAEYGVDPKAFAAWKTSHQPFHWFAEFYSVMRNGGFDVIIGNPPYVEYSKINHQYQIVNLKTYKCSNLYAFITEKVLLISKYSTKRGLILPLSIISTKRMKSIQELLFDKKYIIWLSSFDVYPSKLFDGAKQRLTIILIFNCNTNKIYTTKYNRWWPEERKFLFSSLIFELSLYNRNLYVIPKVGNRISNLILNKISNFKPITFLNSGSKPSFYIHRIPYNYIKAIDFVSYFYNQIKGKDKSEDYKPYFIKDINQVNIVLAIINSNLFFWWWYTLYEGYHCGRHEIFSFPFGLESISNSIKNNLRMLSNDLMKDLKKNKKSKECYYKNTGLVIYDEFYPRYSKPIIDQIDCVLAEHYGFTDEELDYIINYDIKYRMGSDAGEDEA